MKYVADSSISKLALGSLIVVSACGKLPGFAINEKTDAFLQQPVYSRGYQGTDWP